uniref:Uncharacterized protein n=1 Tax=viral metagenome TaxID=1070528 RepID=A0A6C0E0F6_9ZZZZ
MTSNELNRAYINPQPILRESKSEIITNPLIQPSEIQPVFNSRKYVYVYIAIVLLMAYIFYRYFIMQHQT